MYVVCTQRGVVRASKWMLTLSLKKKPFSPKRFWPLTAIFESRFSISPAIMYLQDCATKQHFCFRDRCVPHFYTLKILFPGAHYFVNVRRTGEMRCSTFTKWNSASSLFCQHENLKAGIKACFLPTAAHQKQFLRVAFLVHAFELHTSKSHETLFKLYTFLWKT